LEQRFDCELRSCSLLNRRLFLRGKTASNWTPSSEQLRASTQSNEDPRLYRFLEWPALTTTDCLIAGNGLPTRGAIAACPGLPWPATLPPSTCRRGWGSSLGSACRERGRPDRASRSRPAGFLHPRAREAKACGPGGSPFELKYSSLFSTLIHRSLPYWTSASSCSA
jgi:hypothetical protein